MTNTTTTGRRPSSILNRNDSTSTISHTNTEFFQAVYLDSPSVSFLDHPESLTRLDLLEESGRSITPEPAATSESDTEGDYEDLVNPDSSTQLTCRFGQRAVGGTKPLRVKKKSFNSVGRVGGPTRRRGSTLSVPRSPRSPISPTSFRTATGKSKPIRKASSASTTSSRQDPHTKISRLFLSLPDSSPSPTICHSFAIASAPNSQTHSAMETKRSSGSSLHLGLGRFRSHDPIVPGPSPPISPAPSPTRRAFVTPENIHAKKALPLPPPPLTPSRAPRKAAELLGASHSFSRTEYRTTSSRVGRSAKKHFRPLPHSTKVEIDRFFGDVPKKKKSTNPAISGGAIGGGQSKSESSKSKLEGPIKLTDRRVGEGKSVEYEDQDGNMWLDVEEEEEFAWLMSEVLSTVPIALSPPVNIEETDLHVGHDGEVESQKWGMETFTSVLGLPRPKQTGYINIAGTRHTKPRRTKGSEGSFLNLDFDTPRKVSRPSVSTSPEGVTETDGDIYPLTHPWFITKLTPSPPPATAAMTLGGKTISSPMPTLIPPPRISSKQNTSISSPGSTDTDSDTSLSSLPKKTKNRPPPLTLPKTKPNPKLPVLAATTPCSKPVITKKKKSQEQRTKATNQVTYLLEPLSFKPDVSETKSAKQPPITPFTRPRTAPRPTKITPSTQPIAINIPIPLTQQVSVFEPVTPIEAAGAGGSKGKGWLKRVVRDFGGIRV
ncbi:hypothetical protein IAR55_001885 [Kwoniella newhampshirensis]|uniref:Uncharacterized protein n=1 Tax=Kwoniella newhampshirensis TaxID=1651941 RepID=A0AAW0Z3G1_9TREE